MNKNGIIMGLLFLLTFIVGFYFGRVTDTNVNPFTSSVEEKTAEQKGDMNEQTGAQTNEQSTEQQESATPISPNALTDGQRKMLEAMGIDPNTVTVTPQMVACAEAKLGPARIEEIKNGATPSFTEGVSLVACYK